MNRRHFLQNIVVGGSFFALSLASPNVLSKTKAKVVAKGKVKGSSFVVYANKGNSLVIEVTKGGRKYHRIIRYRKKGRLSKESFKELDAVVNNKKIKISGNFSGKTLKFKTNNGSSGEVTPYLADWAIVAIVIIVAATIIALNGGGAEGEVGPGGASFKASGGGGGGWSDCGGEGEPDCGGEGDSNNNGGGAK